MGMLTDTPTCPPKVNGVLFLNGFPEVGKFATSKILAEKLPASDRLLLDNHLLIDPAIAIVPGQRTFVADSDKPSLKRPHSS